jgi:hypothetical protein
LHSGAVRSQPGGESNISLGLLQPNTPFLERRNELDVRFGKVLRFGRARIFKVSVNLDF